ncbi:unnamed protein product [Bemisia tabaci]|uniref:Heme haloperoxidase family profile domain-containing protein n=1 Tax=Bemisia tabaci TaxID=7038 RepID=A0A9P0AL68_BEMTA|nr:unnamed protein product [Bemisia tabaci]
MRPMSCASLVTLATLATAIPFDAKTQRISTSGVHKFMPPDWSAGHVRGPCPALNALSNHGHMSRDGVVHWAEWARATNEVYGLGRELAFFLAVYGVFVAGNGTHCSIGGATPLIDTSILGPLGLPPGGLTGSHNNYEGDASPCRCDLYKCGEAHRLHVDLFTALYDLRGYKGYLTYDDIVTHRIARRKDSENTNGYFTAAVIAPIAATGAFSFIQLFGNHSEEYPDGWLDGLFRVPLRR